MKHYRRLLVLAIPGTDRWGVYLDDGTPATATTFASYADASAWRAANREE